MCRLSTLLLAALILVALAVSQARADKEEQVHNGVIVSITADTLVMTDAMGKNQHSHKVETSTAITIDGKPAKLPELTKGDAVKVAVGQDGKVTRIEATRAKKEPAPDKP